MATSNATRGKGYRKDPSGHRKTPFGRMLALRGIAPDAPLPSTFLDLLDDQPRIFDQGESGSCVAHAIARAIAVRMKATADTLTWIPSPASIYAIARCLDIAPEAPLEDGGCEPNQAVRGIAEWGIRPMGPLASDGRFSDVDPATVNVKPGLADLEADAHTTMLGAYEIASGGAQREQEIKTALFHGFPVTVAVDASDNSPIQSYVAGDSAIANMGTDLDHYTCALCWRAGDAGFELGIANSWGDAYGENGLFWLRGESIQQLGALTVFDVRKVVSP